jgi:hypothetical protein
LSAPFSSSIRRCALGIVFLIGVGDAGRPRQGGEAILELSV